MRLRLLKVVCLFAMLSLATDATSFIHYPIGVHQYMTSGAAKLTTFLESQPSGETIEMGFTDQAIAQINIANVLTDSFQGPAHFPLHFDGEKLLEGSQRLIDLRTEIVHSLTPNPMLLLSRSPSGAVERELRASTARDRMGEALRK